METSIELLRTALRVLTAITDYQHPDAADVESLRTYAPCLAHEPEDELARDVILQALEHRAAAQAAAR